jgi:magnesium chelatase accessory protein
VFRKPDWDVDGQDWPNRDASRFVRAAGLRWHVQVMGDGPVMLLLHGSGAATHSWRDLAPRLAPRFTVVAPDLPGHGFTDTPDGPDLTLPGVARAVADLVKTLGVAPEILVGHSAGAAIALRLALDAASPPGGVIGLNGALAPFWRTRGALLPALMRGLFLNPLAIATFARRGAQPGAVERLIAGTGSRLDAAGLAQYAALMRSPGHIAGTLGMMARWDLHALVADLPRLRSPLLLVAAEGDRTVPPSVSRDAAAKVPGAEVLLVPGLGHLMHEEAPEQMAAIISARAALWLAAAPRAQAPT